MANRLFPGFLATYRLCALPVSHRAPCACPDAALRGGIGAMLPKRWDDWQRQPRHKDRRVRKVLSMHWHGLQDFPCGDRIFYQSADLILQKETWETLKCLFEKMLVQNVRNS